MESGRALIRRYRPDAILVGGSGPDAGIDEALILAGGGRPCFVLQDYWGDVNRAIRGTKAVFFVIDEKARQLSWELHRAEAVVSGPPKYRDYDALDLWDRIPRLRERLGLAGDRPIACFFGQAGLPADAYMRSAVGFFRAAATALDDPILCFRRHPNQTPGEIEKMMPAPGAAVTDASRGTAEEWLCLAAISATCFSNCGYDLAYLNRAAPAPLGAMIYVMDEPEIRQTYREWTNLATEPVTAQGLALRVDDAATLHDVIRDGMAGETRQRLWRAARDVLPDPAGASARILDRVYADATGAMALAASEAT